MEGIHVYSNERQCPSQRGDKSEIVKLKILKILKNPLFKTIGLISTKFGIKHLWVYGIQIFTNKGPHSPQGEIIAK